MSVNDPGKHPLSQASKDKQHAAASLLIWKKWTTRPREIVAVDLDRIAYVDRYRRARTAFLEETDGKGWECSRVVDGWPVD